MPKTVPVNPTMLVKISLFQEPRTITCTISRTDKATIAAIINSTAKTKRSLGGTYSTLTALVAVALTLTTHFLDISTLH